MGKRLLRPVKYKGYNITFHRDSGLIFARAISFSKQFLGAGRTKASALKEAKRNLNHLLSVKKKLK